MAKLTEKPYPYLPPGQDWLDKHLADIVTTAHWDRYETTGVISLTEQEVLTAVTRREALTILMSKFLRLVEELDKKDTPLDKLPGISIGDMGGRYAALVILSFTRHSSDVSPTGYDYKTSAAIPKYKPLEPNKYPMDIQADSSYAPWPEAGWKDKTT